MRGTTIIVFFVILIASGCNDRKENTARRLSPDSTRSNQGAIEYSSQKQVNDSVDSRGKPKPVVPLEEMTRTQLNEYKQLLAQKGFYSCCVEPSCRMCLFEFEGCPCEHNLKKKEPVCGECFDKWHNGRGKIKGIKPEEVRKM